MPEKLHEILNRLAKMLRWLGKYHEANELKALSAFLIRNRIVCGDDLHTWNNPVTDDLCQKLVDIKDLIEEAAESDESGCYKLITDYNAKN